MMEEMKVRITNKNMELKECRSAWRKDDVHGCMCLEDILYTPSPAAARFQRLSIFVPVEYMNPDGTVNASGKKGIYSVLTAPVVFENNASGYSEMEHTFLGGPRNYADQYLQKGMVYVTCGCRGRQTKGEDGTFVGKAPATLVDFKMAIRFLRHNRKELPGNPDRMISVGWSAGGAMSALLGVTGNSPLFDEYLRSAGAFMEERDDVYAAQVYCPIIDLEHADLAYEWQFREDADYEASPFSEAGTLTPFRKALSQKLSDAFIRYFNQMKLRNPQTGEELTIGPDGRSGSGYLFLMAELDRSATVYLQKLRRGTVPLACSVKEYLKGQYTVEVPDFNRLFGMMKKMEEEQKNMPQPQEKPDEESSYEGHGMRMELPKMPMKQLQGDDKGGWLSYDGEKAAIRDLDRYTLGHRRRMKGCPSFDFLGKESGENQEYGDAHTDFVHFDPEIVHALDALGEAFPEEYRIYHDEFAKVSKDVALMKREFLINPFSYIGTGEKCDIAKHFRINVGAQDADTSFMMSMILYLKLAGISGEDAAWNLIWDQPHSEADYPGDVTAWIHKVCE